jgi:hypothetical protein
MDARTLEDVVTEGGHAVVEACPDGFCVSRDFSAQGWAYDSAEGTTVAEACAKLTMSRRGPALQGEAVIITQ